MSTYQISKKPTAVLKIVVLNVLSGNVLQRTDCRFEVSAAWFVTVVLEEWEQMKLLYRLTLMSKTVLAELGWWENVCLSNAQSYVIKTQCKACPQRSGRCRNSISWDGEAAIALMNAPKERIEWKTKLSIGPQLSRRIHIEQRPALKLRHTLVT